MSFSILDMVILIPVVGMAIVLYRPKDRLSHLNHDMSILSKHVRW